MRWVALVAMQCGIAFAQGVPDRYRLPAESTAEQRAVIKELNRSAEALGAGRAQESKAIGEAALADSRRMRATDLEGYALHNLALAEVALGNREAAQRLLRRARLLFEVEGNLVGQAQIRLAQGELIAAAGNAEEARRLVESSRRLGEAAGDKLAVINAATVPFQTTNSARTEEGRAQVEELYSKAVAEKLPGVEALALRRKGEEAQREGRLDEAERHLGQSLAAARASRDHESQSHSLRAIGDLQLARSQPEAALSSFSEALVEARAGQHRGAEGNALVRLAPMQRARGELDSGSRSANEALAAFQALRQPLGLGLAQLELGESALRRSQFSEAGLRFREAIATFAAASHPSEEAAARLRLAAFLRGQGGYADAQGEVERATAIYKAARDEIGEAAAAQELGRIFGARDRFDDALARFNQSREIYLRHGRHGSAASADLDIGAAANILKRHDVAEAASLRASRYYAKMKFPREQARAEHQLGIALAARGSLPEARKTLATSADLARGVGDTSEAMHSLIALSRVAAAQDDYAAAQKAAREALILASKDGDVKGMGLARAQLRSLEGKIGR